MAHILYLDRAGRVVIPKPVRERFGLRPGEPIELLETGDELRLRPHAAHAPVVRATDGAISFEGQLPPDFDVSAAVDAVRAARARAGWP